MNGRRRLLIALGAGSLSVSMCALAQGRLTKVHRIAFLGSYVSKGPGNELDALKLALRELGHVEGENLIVETRLVEGQYERFPTFAADLVRSKVDLIVTQGPQATKAAQRATNTIPIVMANSDDPVASNFVKSLSVPGGNITGLSNQSDEIGAKHIEILLSLAPGLRRLAVLVNPNNVSSGAVVLKSVQRMSQIKGIDVVSVEATSIKEINAAFETIQKEKCQAVVLVQDAVFQTHRAQIASLALSKRLPTIFRNWEFAQAGGLISYGPRTDQNFRRAAVFVDKILRGAKPGSIPVEQPTAYSMVINGATARSLGITIPPALSISADRIIE